MHIASSSSSNPPKADIRKEKGTAKSSMESHLDYLNKLSRGEFSGVSSSDDENESISDGDEVEYGSDQVSDDEHSASTAEYLADGDETSRIAIQNCYWDKMKADDILYASIYYIYLNLSILSLFNLALSCLLAWCCSLFVHQVNV